MAGSVRKVLAYLGLADDEYSDYDDLDRRTYPRGGANNDRYEDDYAPEPPRRPRPRPEPVYEDDYAPEPPRQPVLRPVPPRNPLTGQTQPPTRAPRPSSIRIQKAESAEVITVAPRTFSDAQEIADHLKANRPVIVNLEAANEELGRRMTDFCSGVGYALGCKVERVAAKILLFTPNNVTVRAEDRGQSRFDS
jgi:cell division inhibitor SepF